MKCILSSFITRTLNHPLQSLMWFNLLLIDFKQNSNLTSTVASSNQFCLFNKIFCCYECIIIYCKNNFISKLRKNLAKNLLACTVHLAKSELCNAQFNNTITQKNATIVNQSCLSFDMTIIPNSI